MAEDEAGQEPVPGGAAGPAPIPGVGSPGAGGKRGADVRGDADRREFEGTPAGTAGEGADELGSPEVDWDEMLIQLARQPLEEGWVTLEEASDAAGVSRSTLRSWYRTGQIPSRMVAGVHGPQRLVPLDSVVRRALGSTRARRQLEHARSLEAEVAELRRRVEALERLLGLH